MTLERIALDGRVGAARGEIVVCIPVYGGHGPFVACLDSVLAHTPRAVPVLVCDDASPDARIAVYVEQCAQRHPMRRLIYLRREANVGFPANVNGGLAAAAPADVVVLNSDCEVAEGWLTGLRAAAYDSPRVATATPLTNHGTIVSVPNVRRPGSVPPAPWRLDRAAAAVRHRSLRLRPRIPTAIGHCMYIRRSALDLVGALDPAFAPGYGEEVDFSQRCLLNGLLHVVADEVFVAHHGGASFALNAERLAIQGAHEQMIAERYPHYHDGLRALERTDGPLARALGVARRALLGPAVTLDLRDQATDDPRLLALLRALGDLCGGEAEDGRRLRASIVVSPDQHGLALDAGLAGLTVASDPAAASGADVVHRLAPLHGSSQRSELRALGDRLIVTLGALTRYANPGAFADFAAWEAHRSLTRAVLGGADGALFPSADARHEAIAEGLIDPGRAAVIAPGLDHPAWAGRGTPHEGGQPSMIVCLAGARGRRSFALRLVEALRARHGWSGRLVLAAAPGAAPGAGDRERLLASAALVLDLGLEDLGALEAPAAALAAWHGVPCLSAPGGSFEPSQATLVDWDPEASAERAYALLDDSELRRRHLAGAQAVAAAQTWAASAQALLAFYDQVTLRPAVATATPEPEPEPPPKPEAEPASVPPAHAGRRRVLGRRRAGG